MTIDDEEDEMWGIWGGWYGPNVAPPPQPIHTPNLYIQECPACHAIHEKRAEFDHWCDDHVDLKELWKRRKDPTRGDKKLGKEPWACQGCEKCEDRVVA